jgi:ribosomal protein S18 acetylase RimI-like enzyme
MKEGTIQISNFSIRDFRKGDFEQVSDLWIRTGMGNPSRGDSEEMILESIRIGGTLIVLAENETGRICGTSWMTFDGRRIHLHHFGILPEYQGNGLSHILMRHSMEFVKNRGFQVKLEVHKTNSRAVNLYKKYGFKYLGDYDVYIIRDLSEI